MEGLRAEAGCSLVGSCMFGFPVCVPALHACE